MSSLQSVQCLNCGGQIFHDGSVAGRTIPCPDCGEHVQLPGVQPPTGKIHDEALGFDCVIYGRHPVQAEGRVRGHPFYFRAKWDFWTFTVCKNNENPEVPSCINPPKDEPGFFQDGEYQGFYLSGDYGADKDASNMKVDIAGKIIRNCVKKFVEASQTI